MSAALRSLAIVVSVAGALLCAAGVDAERHDATHLPAVTAAQLAAATHDLAKSAIQATHSLNLNETPLAHRTAEGDKQVVRLSSDVLFDFGSASVRPAAEAKIVELLAPLPRGAQLAVTGFTDSIGTDADNLDLSQRRADAVAALVRAARPDLSLTVTGRGEADPVASNGTPEHDDPAGRAQNRRVELRY